MFWLKSIQIYMDKENITGQDIRGELSRLKSIRMVYCVAIGVTSFSGQFAIFASGFFQNLVETQKYALINLNVQVFLMLVVISAHMYLIAMGFTM